MNIFANMKGIRNIFKLSSAALAILLLTSSCSWFRHEPEEIRPDNVLLIYACGYNSLSNDIKTNIKALNNGYVPEKNSDRILLLAEHLTKSGMNYSTPTEPHLIRYYKEKGVVVRDTLKTYPSTSQLASAEDMGMILADVKTLFDAKHYGMIFSSHATGWLPKGYYSNHTDSEFWLSAPGPRKSQAKKDIPAGAVPFHEYDQLPGPRVRSIGASNTTDLTYEMELADFSQAISKVMKMDYVIIDACLSGGIEVAYELKDACDRVVFSPTEELAEGMDYTTLGECLLEQNTPDLVGLARKYYNKYEAKSDQDERSATVTVVDCSKLPGLASVCSGLFGKYREQIANVDANTVQKYFRQNKHWFYDFEDILVKAGISDAEKAELDKALDDCIEYKAHTEYFLQHFGGFKIENYCGLSMYLPNKGDDYLNGFYKSLKWNIATGLVD